MKLARSAGCISSSSNTNAATGSSGIISSQDGDTEYTSSATCQWLVSSQNSNDVIKFTILSFDTECGYDFLTIYDGPTPLDTNTIAKLCGNRNTAAGSSMVYLSTGSSASLVFITDSYVVRTGFKIQYDILSRNQICSARSDCNNRGSCNAGTCTCDPGYTGLACQTQTTSPLFTPRQRHAITFVESLDIAIVTFGRNFYSTLSDMKIYNFTSSTWIAPDTTKWGNSPSVVPPSRFDHTTFWFNSKLYMYGGQNNNFNVFGDLWTYDINSNVWSRISGISGAIPYLIESTVVIVPDTTTFQIFVTGGITKSGNVNLRLYCFDLGQLQWIDLGYAPVSYQGGSGVYHPETHSINFAITGYPNYDLAYNNNMMYSWKYSIATKIWTPMGLRSPTEVLYLGRGVYDSASETALVHGGLAINSADKCFESSLWQFDLACKNWTLLSTNVQIPRIGHGLIKRNSSIWVFGGYEGVLEGDVTEIPVVQTIPSQTVRDQCRANNYCSFITECDSCSRQPGCSWCNDACGYDDKANPLTTSIVQNITVDLQGYLPNGVCGKFNATTTCPPRMVLQSSTSYTYDIKFQTFQDYYYYWDTTDQGVQVVSQIGGITPSSAQLRLTFMDNLPFPVTTLSGQALIQIPFPQRPYTRIRVSWANNFGISSLIPLDKSANSSSTQGQELVARFTIQVSSTTIVNDYPLGIMDYLIIFLLALAIVLGLTGIAQWIRSFRSQRRNNFTPTIAPPIPELHSFKFIPQGKDPISLERINADGKIVLARTVLVVMPKGGEELPSMSFGTYMKIEEPHIGVKSLNGSQDGILLKIRQSRPYDG